MSDSSTVPAPFEKNPVTVQTMLWAGGAKDATPIINWVLENGGTARYVEAQTENTLKGKVVREAMPEHLAIDTLEGTMRALPGDWIIQGVKGEFYPCKPDIFAELYHRADPEARANAINFILATHDQVLSEWGDAGGRIDQQAWAELNAHLAVLGISGEELRRLEEQAEADEAARRAGKANR